MEKYQYEAATSPDEIAGEFTDLVDDLGYAKTFYPHSKVTQYLNTLASRVYLGIYKNKRRIFAHYPFLENGIAACRSQISSGSFVCFIIFAGISCVAAFSAAHDEGFVRGVLGDNYVEMTEDNIAKGDPFGVFKSGNQLSMFLAIALHNVEVSFVIFAAGFFVSIGSLWFLFTNAVMVGAFQYYFFSKGLGMQSVLVIWIHGTLEISSIIIAGAAGFVLGNSILFPGTLKRISSLKSGAKDGLKMLVGLVPVFVVAAFLEGFVTRYATMPLWLSIFILAGSAAFIVWYFIVYPIGLQKKIDSAPSTE